MKRNLFKDLMDIIYPPRCPVCGGFLLKDGSGDGESRVSICRTCSADFCRVASPLCNLCGTPFISEVAGDHVCGACLLKIPYFETTRAAYLFQGAIREAIHKFKYGLKSSLALPLGFILAEFAAIQADYMAPSLIMPVPLHPKRLRERGFNQSVLLARHVAEKLHTELDFLSLRRIKYTAPQAGLGRKERLKNVRGAFQIRDPDVVKGKAILLVDDITTTGNTLNECARTLKRAGSGAVHCLVLARPAETLSPMEPPSTP